ITPEIRSTLDEMAAAKALAQKSVVAPAAVPPAEQRDAQVLDDEDSLEDYCRDINAALCAKYGDTNTCYGCCKYYVVATYEQYVIACECGTEHYWQFQYVASADGETFTFSEPTAVDKVWVAAERNAARIAEV